MGGKILSIATILLWCLAVGFAQEASHNQPAGLNNSQIPVNSGRDEKLITVPAPALESEYQFQQNIKDIHFDFDRADLRPEDRAILARDAEWLKSHPDVIITLEGDADVRGDIVYNVVLSGERAAAARDALIEMGVPADRIAFATGWGKLYPICSESDENCWSQNRRAHFAIWPPAPEAAQVASR